jgi:hypothetical protein
MDGLVETGLYRNDGGRSLVEAFNRRVRASRRGPPTGLDSIQIVARGNASQAPEPGKAIRPRRNRD